MAEMSLRDVIPQMPQAFQPDKAKGVDAVVLFCVSGEEAGDWTITIRDGTCSVAPGAAEKPKTTFKIDSKDLIAMLSGKANGMQLFMQGRLRIEGDLGVASKFASYFTQ